MSASTKYLDIACDVISYTRSQKYVHLTPFDNSTLKRKWYRTECYLCVVVRKSVTCASSVFRESATQMMMIAKTPKKFRRRDLNPGRAGESRVS